jgi:hypothetical protein
MAGGEEEEGIDLHLFKKKNSHFSRDGYFFVVVE